ncbi:hypothetical protein [Microcoleus vaginatus]
MPAGLLRLRKPSVVISRREEGRGKREEGRRKRAEGRRKREEGNEAVYGI